VPGGNDLVEERDELRVLSVRKEDVSAVIEGESFGSGEGSGAAPGNGGLIDQRERFNFFRMMRAVGVG
jgi:hypothetical protein